MEWLIIDIKEILRLRNKHCLYHNAISATIEGAKSVVVVKAYCYDFIRMANYIPYNIFQAAINKYYKVKKYPSKADFITTLTNYAARKRKYYSVVVDSEITRTVAA